jgi:RNA polymerase sigma-70 factor (ECF subfamily)
MLSAPPTRTTTARTVAGSTSATAMMMSDIGGLSLGAGRLDAESRSWIDRLSPQSREREAAIEALHALLLKAAKFEVHRRHAAFPHLRGNDHGDLAYQSANDALVAVLSKLADFRGDSRFTTWAYKFALFEAAVKVRRRAWQGGEVPLAPERWELIGDGESTPKQGAETSELLAAVQEAITTALSPHQREVLVAVTLNDVPFDLLAERLHTTVERSTRPFTTPGAGSEAQSPPAGSESPETRKSQRHDQHQRN